MNDKELDHLFRQKLDPVEVAPSADAWQQLEAGLQHKKEKKVWAHVSRIAAVIMLLLGSWGAFEYSQQLVPAEQMAKNENKAGTEINSLPLQEEVAQSTTTEEAAAPIQIAPLPEEQKKAVAITDKPAEKAVPTQNHIPVRKADLQQAVAATEEQKQEAPEAKAAVTPVVELNSKPLQALAANAEQVKIEAPIALKEEVIIRYQADEEPQSPAAIASAEPAPDKKENSARKIFGFLKKVTDNSGTSLAELREAKNELLSLNRLAQNGLSRPE